MRTKILLALALQLLAYFFSTAQTTVTVSGTIKDKSTKTTLPFANVVLKTEKDSTFVSGILSNDEGRFTLSNIKAGEYFFEVAYIGYITKRQSLFVDNLGSCRK